MGQRTVPVIFIIVLEIILTPLFSIHHIPHLHNLQRAVVGLAMHHLEPGGLPPVFAGVVGGGARSQLLPESTTTTTTTTVVVITAWLVGWTVLGARRMITRDA